MYVYLYLSLSIYIYTHIQLIALVRLALRDGPSRPIPKLGVWNFGALTQSGS